MKTSPLSPAELESLRSVFRLHAEIQSVKLFGSRAKGTHTARSDVDLAVWGDVDALQAEQIAAELDELPLPYLYDVKPFDRIKRRALRDHIERIGIPLYSKDHASMMRDEEKMTRLVAELHGQFAESAKLETAIRANSGGLGYGS